MIEGLRLLPWVHESERRNPHSADFDCAKCKEMNGRLARQHMRCGYEVPIDGAQPPWSPVMLDAAHQGEYTLCPGYTTKLPEVIEVVRLRMHAKMGSLSLFMHGGEPTEAATVGIEILEGAANEVQAWVMKPKDQGGGGA